MTMSPEERLRMLRAIDIEPDDQVDKPTPADLAIFTPAEAIGKIPPRGWLLGNIFCRGTVSALIAEGAAGKTALRLVQCLEVATGRSLIGDHVHKRGRVLFVLLEDDRNELLRRLQAAMIHHNISATDLEGWLFLSAPGRKGGKLKVYDTRGRPVDGSMVQALRQEIETYRIDLTLLDPLVKAHSLEENSNSDMDTVMHCLAELATDYDMAVDLSHHVNKAGSEAGNAYRGRGASAVKDAVRLDYTLTRMSPEEARLYGVEETDRRFYIRMDQAKVNIVPPAPNAAWYKLVSVPLGNATEDYPNGDIVQTVEKWTPPDAWDGLHPELLNRILDDIDAGLSNGQLYSDAARAGDREAWKVVQKHAPEKTKAQCRQVIRAWVNTGLLVKEDYDDPVTRKKGRKGLRVNNSGRPS